MSGPGFDRDREDNQNVNRHSDAKCDRVYDRDAAMDDILANRMDNRGRDADATPPELDHNITIELTTRTTSQDYILMTTTRTTHHPG